MTPLTFPSFLLFAIHTDPIFHWRRPQTVSIEVQIKGRRLSASNLLLRALRSPSGSGVLLGSEQRKVSYSFRSRKAATLNVTSSGHFTEFARFERTGATARRNFATRTTIITRTIVITIASTSLRIAPPLYHRALCRIYYLVPCPVLFGTIVVRVPT